MNLTRVEFTTLKNHRYILRGFTSLDGRKISDKEFNIQNLDRCEIYRINSIEDYKYYFAVSPDGCTFVFQRLD
jgi:hypothetical protein